MRRRQVIALLGSMVVSPLVARAQQPSRMRRIGVLTGFSLDDQVGLSLLAAFREQLAASGWIEGHNLADLDIRWGDAADPRRLRAHASELTRTTPDVIVVHGARALTAVHNETDRIPIIFASVTDPVATGHVTSLARPGGNVTGFTNYSGLPSPKLLEALKEIAPDIQQVAFVITPDNPARARQLEAMESVAQSFAVKVAGIVSRDRNDIRNRIAEFANTPNGGLVVSSDVFMITHRDLIIAAAAQHRLPAVYQDRSFVAAGGLMSYSVDRKDSYRRVAQYVDRILRGAKPGDLPVQQPGRFEFVLNLKTARTLGLEVPRLLLVRTDEVVE